MTEAPPARRSAVIPALALLLVAVGLGLAVTGAVYLAWAVEQRSWPSVEAAIDDVRVSKSRNLSNNRHRSAPYHWKVNVAYQYEVGGKRYPGHLYTNDDAAQEFTEETRAEARAAELRSDGRVRVYYDPEQPQLAVIERQGFDAIAPIVVGSMLFAVGLWLAKRELRKRRARQRWLEANPNWVDL